MIDNITAEYKPDSAPYCTYEGVGRLCWFFFALCPWLITTHIEPWTTFYNELFMAVALLALFFWGVFSTKQAWAIDRVSLFFIFTAFIPALQAMLGVYVFVGDAFIYVTLLVAFSLLVGLGRRSELTGPNRLVDGLYASFFVAALLSTGLAIYQWFGLTGLGVLAPTMEVGGGRAVAGIGQPNNLATFLVWGIVSIWWFENKNVIGSGVAIFSVAFLLLGVALTGSRTGCLQIVFLALSVVLINYRCGTRYSRLAISGLIIWFFVLVSSIPVLSNVLFGEVGRDLSDLGVRPIFWKMAVEGVFLHPWLGYGWNQVVMLHVELADKYSGLGTIMGQSHNVVLDIILWNGLVGGLIIILASLLWGLKQLRSVNTVEHALVLVGIGVFLVHAMLELPHLYAFFTLPLAVMIGSASARAGGQIVTNLPRVFIAGFGVFYAALLGQMFIDYNAIVKNVTAHRMVAARITGAKTPSEPQVIVLTSLQSALRSLRVEPAHNMTGKSLESFRETVTRYPVTAGLYRYAKAAALNNDTSEAGWALRVLCDLKPDRVCNRAMSDWKESALVNPEMTLVTLPR